MACDICGKTGTSLSYLRKCFQTDDIKALCPDCTNVVENHLGKIRKMQGRMVSSLFKRFMRMLKKSFA